ncbi:unnamed protein product [Heterobilharzia americana]|nr:unnamed protein product [Heterobilharzia americana]
MEDTEQIQLTTDSCLSIEVCLLPSTSWRYEEGISHCKYGVISELKLKTNFSSGFVNTNNISLLYKDVWSENLLLAIQLKSCCTLSGKTNTSKSDFVFFLSLDRITPSKQIRYGIMKRSLNTSLSVTVSENQVDELSIFYQALCDSHFYGNNCNVFCQEQKGLYGNYRCNEETGSRICQNGWSGDACTDAVCEFGCKHGRCTKPNYCHCDTGWYGNDCSQCRVYPGCLHGGCKVNKLDYTLIPFTCECDDGWGGMLCDKDLRYCTKNLNSCRNNGICVNTEAGNGIPYQCVCPPGFRGDHCETIEYDCRIHGCSGHGECIINNVGINISSLVNYPETNKMVIKEADNILRITILIQLNLFYSIKTYFPTISFTLQASCYCQPSYYGNLCQFNQTTCDEFPCQAEGSVCEKLENIDLNLFSKDHHFKCICPPGYGGFNCEIDIDECASKPCKNGMINLRLKV